MKPGLVGGAACGALIVLGLQQIIALAGGDWWVLPALVWDWTFAAIGLFQLFGPQSALTSTDSKTTISARGDSNG